MPKLNPKISEKQLQEAVKKLLSDPARIFWTKSGRRLQVLSPGRLNVHAGPDFLALSILLDGNIIVGNAEFHKRSSEWFEHSHNTDPNYNSLILHIVFEDNLINNSFPFEVLIVDEREVINISTTSYIEEENVTDASTLEEIQNFALLRILRKSAEASKLIKLHGIEKAFKIYLSEFIEKYDSKRRRPIYNNEKLNAIINQISNSEIKYFFYQLEAKAFMDIPQILDKIFKTQISAEGEHLRLEILLNCILPFAIFLSNDEARINLFLWYWSTGANTSYGILKGKFKSLPQNYLWQQQGMLEFIREHGNKKVALSDMYNQYGFTNALKFYKIGAISISNHFEDEFDEQFDVGNYDNF
jgi:hypothetical protein